MSYPDLNPALWPNGVPGIVDKEGPTEVQVDLGNNLAEHVESVRPHIKELDRQKAQDRAKAPSIPISNET